jgi:hypothetical protein
VGRKADAWADAGRIVVAMRDEKPLTLELHDASGKVVGTQDAPLGNAEGRDAIAQLACRIDGVLMLADGKPPATGTFTIRVLKPATPDEAGDLKRMCAGAPPTAQGIDDSMTLTVADATYTETLTSPKWRGWYFQMRRGIHTAQDDAARAKLRSAAAAELRAADANCWFARALEQ